MRVLVTGNLGYIGSHVTYLLMDSNHQVIGCDLNLFPRAVCGPLASPTIQLYKDYRKLTDEDLEGIDAIIHLAALSNDPMGQLDASLTHYINGEGVLELAKRAKRNNVRVFAFASSCSIYGSLGEHPRTEKDPTNPLSAYAKAKLFAERGLSDLASNSFEVYLLRNSTAFGASRVFRTDLVVNDLSAKLSVDGEAVVLSDGTPWRPFIHAKDMARAFKLMIELRPKWISGKPINIGFNSENFQIKTVAEYVCKAWENARLTYNYSGSQDPRNYRVDFSLFESIFPDFLPEFRLDVGIADMKSWLRKISYNSEDRNSGRYVRLKELQTTAF